MTELPSDMQRHNRELIAQFRAAGRRLGDRPMMLLTTIGRRTGLHRTTPMMFMPEPDGARLLVMASNAGAPRHPDWYLNVVADPTVTVEVDGRSYETIAAVTEGAERDRLFAAVVAQYPFFADHQAKVQRAIPVIALPAE
jgi:deazaflavin-dependent oxidoreductase (nitroreductase family)